MAGNQKSDNKKEMEEVTIQLHKEELKVNKKWVENSDVTIYKKTYTQEKQITVPVSREELVIEKKKLGTDIDRDQQTEIIRIPLKEDRIEITLHPTILEDVEIYKNKYEVLKHVIETVKEDKLHIEEVGNTKVFIEDNTYI